MQAGTSGHREGSISDIVGDGSELREFKIGKGICIRALSAATAAKFNIAPVSWQHPSLVAIVPPESKGKTEGNDWDTACGNFKTSISSIYYNKKCICSFSLPK
jgi:hypothetical protein